MVWLLLTAPSVLFISLHVFGFVTEGRYERVTGDAYVISGVLSLPCAVIVLAIWMIKWVRGSATDLSGGLWVFVAWLGAVLTYSRMWF